MAWNYDSAPGTSTADGRRDAVRLLIGDTDTNDQQIQDEEITFALDEASDGVYQAAAIVARAIAGKYARRVDTDFETVSASYSQRHKHYLDLAARLDRQAVLQGGGIGTPLIGGVSESEMDSVEDDDDRVEPAFRRKQFRNPPDVDDDEQSWWHYHR